MFFKHKHLYEFIVHLNTLFGNNKPIMYTDIQGSNLCPKNKSYDNVATIYRHEIRPQINLVKNYKT